MKQDKSEGAGATKVSGRRAIDPLTNNSHARDWGPGFLAKLSIMAAINAIGIFVAYMAFAVESWVIVASSIVILVVANWIYFSRKMIPGKYMFPGLLFLTVFQIFVMGYTAYIAFTNYGSGHVSSQENAANVILAQNELYVPGSPSFTITPAHNGEEWGIATTDTETGQVLFGTESQPLEPRDDIAVNEAEGRPTEIAGWETYLKRTDFDAGQLDEFITKRFAFSEDAEDGSLRAVTWTMGEKYASTWVQDPETGNLIDNTDPENPRVFVADQVIGSFVYVDAEGNRTVLDTGWPVAVGFDNFTRVFTDSRIVQPMGQVLLWTIAFAFLSVVTTFFLGLFLALVLNNPRVKGVRTWRSILILPYAFPAFLSALVWSGLLNRQFGFVNEVLLFGMNIPWLQDPWLAKLSVLMVNLWLGFPYMFLIATGSLQSIPHDVIESANMDGATGFKLFRSITLPMLMVATAPLLIASFAFNFNNFNLIYMLTEGGPSIQSAQIPVGHTDLLISMVYKTAFTPGNEQYGLASAVSILIFICVGAISWFGFRYTRKLEEMN